MEPDHPAAPVAALAEGTPPKQPQGQARPLKRRERDASLRHRIVQIRCNDDEYTQIRERAEAAGVSPPRLLVELALHGGAGASERHLVNQSMGLIRRQVVGMATNLNQLAKWANTRQQLPPGLESTLVAVQRMQIRLDAFLAEIGDHHR